jgi:hypothetical protein
MKIPSVHDMLQRIAPLLILATLNSIIRCDSMLQPIEAFTFLPSPQQRQHSLRPVSPKASRYERSTRSVLTTSSLDVPDESSNNVDNHDIPEPETKWSDVESLRVETLDGETLALGDVLSSSSNTVALSCLSHFGDYNAWEMTQQYMSAVQSGRLSDEWYV